ncbi:MAG TPA: BolA family protein [Vineibacter sp.]|nr:BolA family protein [Vineibacter sp.]
MGAVADSIEQKLRAALAPTVLRVTDDSAKHAGHSGARDGGESHFTVEIVSAAFDGKSRVARQRLVYDLLKAEFAAGLHALALVTKTPAEAGG